MVYIEAINAAQPAWAMAYSRAFVSVYECSALRCGATATHHAALHPSRHQFMHQRPFAVPPPVSEAVGEHFTTVAIGDWHIPELEKSTEHVPPA